MKARYFFTILAFGALSTNVGFAGHRGDRANVDTRAHASGTAAQSEVNPTARGPQSAAHSRASSDQINESTAKDSAGVAPADRSGKHATDTSGSRVQIPTKSDATADAAPAGPFGQPHLATPGNGPRENGAGAPIDTRITVHQGRRAPNSNEVKEIRELNERLFKKLKTVIAPAIDPAHLNIHNHQLKLPLGTDGAPVRNAVGSIIEHRIAGPQRSLPATSDATRQVFSTMPTAGTQEWEERASGMVSTGDTAKQLNGLVPAIGANPMQLNNRTPKTPALAIVTTNSPAVNGTGMIRPGSGGGAVGGPAKVVAGAIGGSSFRPKHP